MTASEAAAPDGTAVRVALWRALHAHIDAPPRIFADDLGLRLVAPADDWRHRPDMDPDFTRPSRVSIVVRSRFIEDLVLQESARVSLSTRRSSATSRLRRCSRWRGRPD